MFYNTTAGGSSSSNANTTTVKPATGPGGADWVSNMARKQSHFRTHGRQELGGSTLAAKAAFFGVFFGGYTACMGGLNPKVNPDGSEIKHRASIGPKTPSTLAPSTVAVRQFWPKHGVSTAPESDQVVGGWNFFN